MILLAGGTKDSRLIAERLIEVYKENKIDEKILVTTATEYGKQLISHLDLEVKVGKLNLEDFKNLVKEKGITKIIDATHPYAIEISKNLLQLSDITEISYYRYERDMLNYEKNNQFYEINDIISFLEGKEENILITLGSNNIDKFSNMTNKKNIYGRVLPTAYAIKKCEDAGFKPSQIIGLQGPFSTEFNEAIYKNYNIKYVVTKESGNTGGELEKVEAARNLGVEVVVLKRPKIQYRNLYSNIEKLIENFIAINNN